MGVVTISRQEGCGGEEIGKKVADRLGYHFVTKETIEGFFRSYGATDFERFYESTHGFWDRLDQAQDASVELLRRVIQAVARHDNVVILGRAGFAFFPNFADVLNVRLWAPLQHRVTHFMDAKGIGDRREAEAMLARSDRIRSRFVEVCFHARPDLAEAFDLSINTAKVATEAAVATIAHAVEALPEAGPEGHRTIESLPQDFVLAHDVDRVLGEAV